MQPRGFLPDSEAQKEVRIPWHRLSPADISLCYRLAVRASKMVLDIKRQDRHADMMDPDPMLIHMDFCLVHLCRDLRLHALLMTNDLEFMEEFAQICRVTMHPNSTVRIDGKFPADVRLLYANR